MQVPGSICLGRDLFLPFLVAGVGWGASAVVRVPVSDAVVGIWNPPYIVHLDQFDAWVLEHLV